MPTTRAFMLTASQERRLREVCRYAAKESGPFWLSSTADELSRLYVRSRRGAQYAELFERNGAGPVRWDDLRIARFDRSDPAGMYAALTDAVESFVDRSTLPPLPTVGTPPPDGLYRADSGEIVRIHNGRPEPAF